MRLYIRHIVEKRGRRKTARALTREDTG